MKMKVLIQLKPIELGVDVQHFRVSNIVHIFECYALFNLIPQIEWY